MTICVKRVLLAAAHVLALSSTALGQDPKPDTTRRPLPVTLPTIQTTAPRDERVVFEQKPNVGTITITGRELTSAPRFFGEADVLRAVRLLPGVTARNDFSVGMNVRGGEADQNLVLLDGYPIYNPFHMGGLFGAFVEPMVERVEFMTGGFPAAYGGRLSSVLDVRSSVEPRSDIHGRADVSLIATTVALGSGMQGGRSTWTVAARRTYADKIADVYKKGSLPYHFGDAQAHLTRVLPGSLQLSFTAYDNVDHLTQSSAETATADQLDLRWGNRLFGATLARTFEDAPRFLGIGLGDSVRLEQRVSRSRFDVHMNLFESMLTLNNRVIDDRVAGSVASYNGRQAL
ncbi:MAG TPA: TonB-dependent receptor plug domain-containing protein, partial [Gemmatimonadaceae bacterium]